MVRAAAAPVGAAAGNSIAAVSRRRSVWTKTPTCPQKPRDSTKHPLGFATPLAIRSGYSLASDATASIEKFRLPFFIALPPHVLVALHRSVSVVYLREASRIVGGRLSLELPICARMNGAPPSPRPIHGVQVRTLRHTGEVASRNPQDSYGTPPKRQASANDGLGAMSPTACLFAARAHLTGDKRNFNSCGSLPGSVYLRWVRAPHELSPPTPCSFESINTMLKSRWGNSCWCRASIRSPSV